MPTTRHNFVGLGQFYLGVASLPVQNLVPIGQVSEATIAVETNELSLKDYQNPGGGNANRVDQITSVTTSLTLRDFRADNLGLAFQGLVSDIAASTVTDEAHTVAQQGSLIRTANMIDTSQTVVVTGTGGTPVHPTTAYRVSAAGIVALDGGAIAGGSDIEVDYSVPAAKKLEALVASPTEYRLVLDGLNEAESNKPFLVEMRLVRFSPSDSFGLISADDFAGTTLNGEMLSDSTVTTPGISRFFSMTQIEG